VSVAKRRADKNGPRFLARDFTEFSRLAGMTHVTTSPH
jgi:hypothetical protein